VDLRLPASRVLTSLNVFPTKGSIKHLHKVLSYEQMDMPKKNKKEYLNA